MNNWTILLIMISVIAICIFLLYQLDLYYDKKEWYKKNQDIYNKIKNLNFSNIGVDEIMSDDGKYTLYKRPNGSYHLVENLYEQVSKKLLKKHTIVWFRPSNYGPSKVYTDLYSKYSNNR